MSEPPSLDRQQRHQVNERTFQAWLRTAIALIGFGFALARFSLSLRQIEVMLTQQQPYVHPIFNADNLGVGFAIAGILAMGLAVWRYNQVFWQIERSHYRSSQLALWVMAVTVTILAALSILLLL